MSYVAVVAGDRPVAGRWRFGTKIADWTIGLIVFLGAFVIDEPAPYELLLIPVIIVWSFLGLKLNRHFMPMTVLLVLYVIGGILALTQSSDLSTGLLYDATTTFLALSAVFFAAVIAEAPERRLTVIKRAYIAAAAVAALLGIAAYFHAIPDWQRLLLYSRVKSTFQDPNVFGPFLVLPITLLFHDILTHRPHRVPGKALLFLLLIFAEFLAFSRAAWGMTVLALMVTALLAFVSEPRMSSRFRMVAYVAGGFLIVALLLTVVLSIPAVSHLFAERAHLVESYDAGRLGRFNRQILGFFLVQQHPLGLGPLEFSKIFGEDEHNTWLKGFTTYGWIGGFAYIALAIWTIAASARLLFKPRAWMPMVQCAFAVFLGQMLIHNVIDNDHWRHLFLLYGILWGAVAAEKTYVRQQRWLAAKAASPPLSMAAVKPYRAGRLPRATPPAIASSV